MVHLRGAGAVPFGRELDPAEMVQATTERTLEDAEVDAGEVDHLVVANAAAEGFNAIGNVSVWTATHAGVAGTPSLRVDTGPSSGLAALTVARGLVAAGYAENVLVLGWEAMTTVPTAEATRLLGKLMSAREQELGLSLPALVAMLTHAYLTRYDLRIEETSHLPVRSHELALSNPIAQFHKEITSEDVEASRLIADPLRLLHCAPLTDGAAGLVVGREGPVRIEAMGHATDHLGYHQRRGPPERFEATRRAAQACFASSRHDRADVDVVELHDAFSPLEPVNVEDLGFAEPGEGLTVLPGTGEDPLSKRPVVNPSGGLKARGHPIGATGVAQIVELFDQLTGRAANPVDDTSVALAHNIGGFGNNVHCALLEEVAP